MKRDKMCCPHNFILEKQNPKQPNLPAATCNLYPTQGMPEDWYYPCRINAGLTVQTSFRYETAVNSTCCQSCDELTGKMWTRQCGCARNLSLLHYCVSTPTHTDTHTDTHAHTHTHTQEHLPNYQRPQKAERIRENTGGSLGNALSVETMATNTEGECIFSVLDWFVSWFFALSFRFWILHKHTRTHHLAHKMLVINTSFWSQCTAGAQQFVWNCCYEMETNLRWKLSAVIVLQTNHFRIIQVEIALMQNYRIYMHFNIALKQQIISLLETQDCRSTW